ncbi:hypothetical protein GCM10025783_20070 [Amnibacterium soli]|uniref:2-oxoglutarate dehydrogenase n=1 Tax=Amnibacterium soli TaxID=1282736 RepID=A0ABP8Z6M3_9MICO
MTARRLLAALLAAATATIGLAAQPAAAATSTSTTSVVVAPDRAGVVDPDRGLGVSVTVTNSGSTRLAAGSLAFSLDYAPVASTATLLGSIAKPPEALQGQLAAANVDVPALDPDSSRTLRATLSKKDLSTLLSSRSGARRLYVQYLTGQDRTIAVSSITKMTKGDGATVGFGTVIPVVAPRTTTGVVEVTTQQQLVADDGAWSRALLAAQAAPAATVALDPAVLASIRLAGSSAPSDVTAFLERLGQLPNQFVRLPYADVDETLARAAGVDPRADVSFTGATLQTAAGDDAAPAPAPTQGTSDAVPTELTAWNWSDQAVSWPVPHTAGPGDVSTLARGGSTLLLPSDDVTDSPARRTAGPLADVPGGRVLVSDTTASSLLAAASGEGQSAASALATLTGVLATAAATRETSALLATTGRSSDGPDLDRALALLGRQPWIRMRSLAQLGGQTTRVRVGLKDATTRASVVATARSLTERERPVQELRKAITANAGTVIAPQRLALLGMLSAAWRGDDSAWRAGAAVAEKAFTDVAKRVHVLKGSDSNAIGTDGILQVTVSNELPVPVRVRIDPRVSNGRLQFQSTSDTTVDIPARSNKLSKLAFKSITNGSTDVTLSLEAPDGTTIGDSVTRRVSVTAGFDTVVAVALISALGLLLALGIYRNIQRRRHPKAAEA